MLPNATPITIAVPPMKAGTMKPVHVIGGGLAGSEAAWQLARAGVPVVLHEMRPKRGTDAHQTDGLAELVCSNSFRSDDSESNALNLTNWGYYADTLTGIAYHYALPAALAAATLSAFKLSPNARLAVALCFAAVVPAPYLTELTLGAGARTPVAGVADAFDRRGKLDVILDLRQ